MTRTIATTTRMNNNQAELRKRQPRTERVLCNNKLTVMSAAAMGKALVLLATSCAAFSHSSIGPSTIMPSSAIHSRPGQQQQQQQPVSSTSLSYSPLSSEPDEVDEEQVAMDEYINYVGRRNNRLHQSNNNGPLDILGLSGLASASLRRRLCVPRAIMSGSNSLFISPGAESSLARSSIRALGQIRIMWNTLQRVLANYFSLRMIPELINQVGLSVAGLAVLFVLRPLLKGTLLRQG